MRRYLTSITALKTEGRLWGEVLEGLSRRLVEYSTSQAREGCGLPPSSSSTWW
jgi:hypothetical protein